MTSPSRRTRDTVVPSWAATGLFPTAVFTLCCILLAGTSSPRRVGDGVEYWAMAEQMRTGLRPSASRAELARLERAVPGMGAGFDRSPLRFQHLVGADGRQDFPHFWLYPLVNVPALALVSALGMHPGWAFTLTNIVLLAAAFARVSRRVSIAWATLLLADPLIWWIDKAHGDVFTVTLLAAGCALWRAAPGWTTIAVALAAAQNPAIMPVWAIVCLAACWQALRASRARTRCATSSDGAAPTHYANRTAPQRAASSYHTSPRSLVVAVAISAAIVAVPLAYYQTRLGVWSPLIGYTHPAWPSARAIASLLVDLNIGLLPNAPFLMLAGAWALAMRARTAADSRPPWRDAALAVAACVLMLMAFAQSVNLNHGATPGMNRWTLWLTPWLLLIVSSPKTAGARVLTGLAVLNIAWSVWFFRPSLPEVYRYPTMAAEWMWRNAPGWYEPVPEIFAERVSHREPATVPVASPGCTKVLIVDGQWPASCVPTAPAPADCLGADRLCYATPSAAAARESGAPGTFGTSTTFTPLGNVSFPWAPAARAWPANAPFVSALHAELMKARARTSDALESAEAIVRATNGVGWSTAWAAPDGSRLAIYVQDVSPGGASLDVRVDADYAGQLIDLDTGAGLATVTVSRSLGQPSTIALPASVRHGLIRLERP